MRIFYLAIASTCSLAIFAQKSPSVLQSVSHKVETAESITYLGKSIVQGFSYLVPSEEQQLRQRQLQHNLEVLQAEENLKKCLVDNAFKDREQGEFPTACEGLVYAFLAKAGVMAATNLRTEFNVAMSELPRPAIQNPVISPAPSSNPWPKRLFIGGMVIAATGGLAFFASPFLLPGSVVATKATAATAAIKTTVATVGTKAATIGGAAMATSGATAVTIASIASEAKSSFEALSMADKLKVTADVMKKTGIAVDASQYIGSYMFDTNESQLQRLRQSAGRLSLKERIAEAHFKDKK